MSSETSPAESLILVVDDEPQLRRLLRITLEARGYRVIDAVDGREALRQVAERRPDAVLLDLGLPDLEGLTVLERIREWSRVPILVLTVRDAESDKVAALDAGADDYVTKPFGSAELLARLRAALRHALPPAEDAVIGSGPLRVDLAARRVWRGNDEVHLTPIEYALLRHLATHAGKVLTHRQLLTAVWGPGSSSRTHHLRVHLANLRRKLGDDSDEPRWIRTEAGVGYRFLVG